MEIKEITNKNTWEGFFLNVKEKTFLNSWNWGEFQKKQGESIWRLGVYDQKLAEAFLVIKVKAKRGTFLFVPHGPTSKHLKDVIIYLKELAKKEEASFIRISPLIGDKKVYHSFGFRDAPIHIHPELTWELDISISLDELLANMRKTTRYLLKKGEKNKEIEIIRSNNINDLKEFYNIYQETAKRHHFVPFSLDYLQKQFSSFNPDNQITIYLGKYKGKIISAAVMIFWQGTGFYHHGASSSHNSNKVPISYLLQWEAIKEAQRRGCLKYNFWGIAPNDNKKHPWAGLTLFKKGFGGQRVDYLKTMDLPLSPKYYFTYFIEKVRKAQRRL